MQTTKRLIAILMTILLTLSGALAQEPQRNQPGQTVSRDVAIIIQQQQVRFAATQVVEQLHLQVSDQAGEVVFDSGAAGVQEINWLLQYANGAPLKSGLYAYTLTLKEVGKEAQVRRGHFIVDRAQDRDGQTDRLWITSQGQSGVGTELTVAQSEAATIAGTSTNRPQSNLPARDQAPRTVEDNNQPQGNKTENQQLKGTAAAQTISGSLTLQGSEDPLLELNHIGSSGSPAIWFKQDGVPQAFVWWDKYNRRLNLGTPGINPILALQDNGNVGIGTATPGSKLDINAQDGLRIFGYQPFFTLTDSNSGYSRGRIQSANGNLGFQTESEIRNGLPSVVEMLSYVNPDTPRLLIRAQNSLETIGYQPFLTLTDSNAGFARARIQNINGGISFQTHALTQAGGSALYIQNGTQNVGIGTVDPQAKLDVAGQTRTQSLQITGGADFAENFDVNIAETTAEATTTKVEAGMVVSIDPASPGKLALSTQAYDYQVAGIISGAGGVKPGMMMSQAGTLADGQYPVALSGRVYCWADAANGAIKPGDLLTTSATPGHAMKVTDREKAQGAIIGKAMTGLKEGKGLVLVLVTLQ